MLPAHSGVSFQISYSQPYRPIILHIRKNIYIILIEFPEWLQFRLQFRPQPGLDIKCPAPINQIFSFWFAGAGFYSKADVIVL